MNLRKHAALLATLITALALHAADLEPKLGAKGKVLLEEKFDGEKVPAGWNKNTGKISVAEGVLHASELASDMHIGAFRKALPVQDCAIQLDFKFAGARTFNVGFDPAPGELKKKGHLFSLAITAESWNITEHNDKADPNSKNVARAKAAVKFEAGQWHTLLLEVKGNDVVAQVAGREPLRATAKDFHVKKPGLVFRVGGKDGQEVLFDNVKVWELK
ncbi:MAG: hypothetical protein HY301_05500 [Verrucomicrobia bacterium]|nr:hypothetical protein [Verrucomicrobiota bacterium]